MEIKKQKQTQGMLQQNEEGPWYRQGQDWLSRQEVNSNLEMMLRPPDGNVFEN